MPFTFESDEEKERIRTDEAPPEAIQIGEKYRHEIISGYMPSVSVKRISEQVGDGLFAEEDIPKGAYVGEYTGQIRMNYSLCAISDYCFRYPVLDHLGRNYVIDAINGNLTRYINHSYKPNLNPVYAFVDGYYYLIFLAIDSIPKGTQLTFNYGQGYWHLRGQPVEF